MKKLMAVNPPEVYAWDDAGNNRWLISGKGSSIMNPPSAWAVAKRDNPTVAANCWTHPMPKGPKGRFVGQLPQFYGLWQFSKNKSAAKDLLVYISQKELVAQLVQASSGYDLPSFKTMYDLDTWKIVEPPVGTVYGYPPRGDEQTSMAGAPARSEVGAQIYNQAINTVMVAKVHPRQREDRCRDQMGRERARRHATRLKPVPVRPMLHMPALGAGMC